MKTWHITAGIVLLSLCILLTHKIHVESIEFLVPLLASNMNVLYYLVAALIGALILLIYDLKRTEQQLIEDMKQLGLREFEAKLLVANADAVFNTILSRAADRLYYALLTQSYQPVYTQNFVKQPRSQAASSLENQKVVVHKVMYECPECGFLVSSLEELQEHMREEHEIELEV